MFYSEWALVAPALPISILVNPNRMQETTCSLAMFPCRVFLNTIYGGSFLLIRTSSIILSDSRSVGVCIGAVLPEEETIRAPIRTPSPVVVPRGGDKKNGLEPCASILKYGLVSLFITRQGFKLSQLI